MKSPRVLTLPNGLRIVLAPQPDAPTATVLVMVRAGSEDETPELNGVSHFLEHLAFKGTGRYPEPGELNRALEGLGADNNAWTTETHTAYWAKAQSSKAQRILEIMADLHLDPLLRAEDVDRERGVILEEIAMYEDRPTSKVADLLQELAYGDQPAGRPVAGTKGSVKGITREQVVAYRAARYRAPDTVICMAGGFDAGEAAAFLRKRFASLDARPARRKRRTREAQSAPAVRLMRKRTDQAHLQLGFRSVPLGHELEPVLRRLAVVLGGGSSSRLFHRIREEMGAAYYVSAWNDFSLDHGMLGASVGASLGKEEAVLGVIMEEFARVTDELVSAAEMRRARDYQIGGFLMGMESSDAIATHYAEDLLLSGRVYTIREVVAEMRAITADQVRRAARKVIRLERLNVAGIGPSLQEAQVRKLLRLR